MPSLSSFPFVPHWSAYFLNGTLAELPDQFSQLPQHLPMALMDVEANLGNQGVCRGYLRQGIYGDGKLADADQADAELRDRHQSAGELTNRNDTRAGTGTRLGRYLKETWSKGRPRNVVWDLYSNPYPSHLSFAGKGAPHFGQDSACSEISWLHSRQGFILVGH